MVATDLRNPDLIIETQANTVSNASRDTGSVSMSKDTLDTDIMRLRVSIGGTFSQREPGAWKYVGGDTFLESVPVSWKYADLVFSLAEKVDGAISLKYQLPGEDLDPDGLISVADDSDIAELFDEYFRALRLPNTPIKTFRLRLFLFRAAEVPYTPEDLEAEARYLEMMPFSRGGASIFDSDASSTRGEDMVDGMTTPSTVAETELAWEAGFKAGQEAAMMASEEQWGEVLTCKVAELAQTASDYMLSANPSGDLGEQSPPPSLPAPGVPHTSPSTDGRHSPASAGVGAVSAQMGEASLDPTNDPEFQSMFESKYERKSVAPGNGNATKDNQHGGAYSGFNDGINGQQQKSQISALSRPPSEPSADTATAAALAAAVEAARAATRPSSTEDMPNAAMPSPATRLPTHISIFGDDLEPAQALAVVAKFGPPPAAAANLPSHISEFGGTDDGGDNYEDNDGKNDEEYEENQGELEAVAIASAALPEEDKIATTTTTTSRPKVAAAAAPDAALLPTRFDLLDTSSAAAVAGDVGVGGPVTGVGEGGLPKAPASLHRPPPSILSSVHQVDSGQLTVLAKIGEGSFGEVSLCQCPTYGKVAVKWIKSTKVERWASFWREAELMSRLNHPNVLRFFGLVTQGEFVVGIMTEFAASGSLAAFMRKGQGSSNTDGPTPTGGGAGFLPLQQRAHLALHAANGMAYLHSQKIVHFDVKPDNLLVDGDWNSSPDGPVLKVADFGLSVVKANTFCSDVHDLRGTLPYMAPEMITDHKHVTEAADVWSLGVVFWELLTQQQPYADIAPAQLLGALGSGTARLPIPEWCEPEWRAVMEGCWIEDPTLRPTCRQLALQLQRIRDIAARLNNPHLL
ncbi:hypothetical protein Ndes2526B_g01686 [Nannochloris sp. 'desiccata']|nr:hypothetical protein KSW81_005823 [Chlorella desiccata (nom. nud.)]KAH7623263.1 putative Serine/threonine-protein kinase CTR1 [Chlorella desiccata (nom. nud.)]